MPEKHLTREARLLLLLLLKFFVVQRVVVAQFVVVVVTCVQKLGVKSTLPQEERCERLRGKCELEKTRAKVTFTVIRALHFVFSLPWHPC